MKIPDPHTPIPPWHAIHAEDVLSHLNTNALGLSAAEAEERLSRTGHNEIKSTNKRSAWKRFFLQFHNLFIYVLLVSASHSCWITRSTPR